jgi:hypothetical protein
LWSSLKRSAEIGRFREVGLRRLTLSGEDQQMRDTSSPAPTVHRTPQMKCCPYLSCSVASLTVGLRRHSRTNKIGLTVSSADFF